MNLDHIDPELRDAIANRPALRLSAEKLAKSRDFIVQAAKVARKGIDDSVKIDELEVHNVFDGHVIRVVRYQPDHINAGLTLSKPALLHAHAGGFVMGIPEMAEPDNLQIVRNLHCTLFSVDYRLAPENPFPAALRDVYSVLLWLHEHADKLNIDRNRIGIKGESGGGGIAASMAQYARDHKGPRILFQHLTYPMLDDRTAAKNDRHEHIGQIIWNNEHNRFGWQSLLGFEPGASDTSAYASPARALDLSGLPPTFISVGTLDLFCEENMAYARRLAKSGVPLELHVYPGAYHGFRSVMSSRVAQQAERDSHEALSRGFYG